MDIDSPLTLLGGLTPAQFMKRHWQKKPLLVRGAIPGFQPLLARKQLFELAGRDEVESRLVAREGRSWRLQRGPFTRRALPPLDQPAWTLLVQGVDLHAASAHELLQRFTFVPAARLDDLMISWASDGGGVGPHFDSYDVFLLQAQGQRRWRIGRQQDLSLRDDLPLKILANFEPEAEYVLEPGDMLYLPPRYAHDGIAEGECQTCSIGFRAPAKAELARELLQRIADEAGELEERIYRDPAQPATAAAGAIPEGLRAFAQDALAAALKDSSALDRALGEYLTEPKANVWFEAGSVPRKLQAVVLDAKTRMLHDAQHVFVNGESWRAAGRDATLMRKLADRRRLERAEVEGASEGARELLRAWCEAGWAHAQGSAR
ncbi:cupin domain-containing protein [Ramlibacter sp. G-1-2-2]|uniref:Cupin domain-containing protein n=1 Tax=Ramlibacter agri TaxID=2728837 RepID=A0A848HA90_9BURK|nr:cupin domain-containing protein [Ramlibacter agri]NML46351.1 cupin domain-containing protein [Ramlibacter agri]